MTVEPTRFVAAMAKHWQNTLSNTVSEALQAVWHQMAVTFNEQITGQDIERWRVLQPTTGTGKSQGLAVYCSLLSDESHPGVLIVTRLKTQADTIADTVNTLAGREVARSYHTDNRTEGSPLAEYPVVVITHRAYEIGLDAVNTGQGNGTNWSRYHEWRGGRRKLVVIDEALDIIEEAQIDLDKVRSIQAIVPFDIAERFPEQMKAIAMLQEVLEGIARIAKDRDNPERERILWSGNRELPSMFDMTPLRRVLLDMRLDRRFLRRKDPKENKKLAQGWDVVLRDIHSTLANWNWYSKKLADHTINTARLIVPEDIAGAVVMDATASSNLIYQLFDKAEVLPVPSQARSYANVTLHVSTGHAVGKTTMVRNAKEEAPKLIQNLKETIGSDRKVFVCCHQYVEPHLMGFDTGFAKFDVGHWNAVDGRNDWQDFDTAVIFGLPYRDRVWSANTFMALRGLQDNDWLNAEGERPFKGYPDIRRALEVGQLTVSVVQAINRVRSRRVIDEQGNCPPTDVFLLLPGDATGKAILEGIEYEMPGIKVQPWHYENIKRKPRKSNHEEALIRFARVMGEGRWSISDIRKELSIPPDPMKRLAIKMKDQTNALYRELAAAGVRYEVVRTRRTQQAHLVKE